MDLSELARYVYFGGVKSPRLRPLIWLYLLGHYPPGSGEEDRRILDQECIQQYQKIRAEDEEIKKVSCPSISHFIVQISLRAEKWVFVSKRIFNLPIIALPIDMTSKNDIALGRTRQRCRHIYMPRSCAGQSIL